MQENMRKTDGNNARNTKIRYNLQCTPDVIGLNKMRCKKKIG